jgi:hypothetical protein
MPAEESKPDLKVPPEIQAFLAGYPLSVQEIALRMRQVVLSVVPGAIEQLDLPARLIGYGFDRTYRGTICVIMPLKAAVNLGFPTGSTLADPEGYLSGTGKRARHVKITEISQVEMPGLLLLLEASTAAARQR